MSFFCMIPSNNSNFQFNVIVRNSSRSSDINFLGLCACRCENPVKKYNTKHYKTKNLMWFS